MIASRSLQFIKIYCLNFDLHYYCIDINDHLKEYFAIEC